MINQQQSLTFRKQDVWDPMLRCFHWLLVVLFLLSWWSEGRDIRTHIVSGTLLFGLLLFRLIWGVVGERNALFASFYPSLSSIQQHGRELLHFKSGNYIAHTPIGSVMIFILFSALIVLSGTGMGLLGLQMGLGIFAHLSLTFESELFIQTIHHWSFIVLQFLVAIHLLGVLLESWLQQCNLVMAMINGKKTIKENHS
jgi:cytochrome b